MQIICVKMLITKWRENVTADKLNVNPLLISTNLLGEEVKGSIHPVSQGNTSWWIWGDYPHFPPTMPRGVGVQMTDALENEGETHSYKCRRRHLQESKILKISLWDMPPDPPRSGSARPRLYHNLAMPLYGLTVGVKCVLNLNTWEPNNDNKGLCITFGLKTNFHAYSHNSTLTCTYLPP